MTDPDLTTQYLGLTLRNPIVASASPANADVNHLIALEAAGIGAVVLPSLFEEQIENDLLMMDDLGFGGPLSAEAVAGHRPNLDAYNTGPSDYLTLVESAVEHLDVPVSASLNGISTGGWTSFAKQIEDGGADALELNIYLVAANSNETGQDIEDRYLQLVEEVRATVSIPLAVKLGPYFSSPANMAKRLADAGADGLVLFNRFYQPDIDLDTLTVTPNLVLSNPAEMRLVLRWMALLHGRIDASLAATTGVHQAEDAVKLILAGADVVMITSALLQHGADYTTTIIDGVRQWFAHHEYTSLDQGRGSLSQQNSLDPSAFERANYTETIASYVARHAT